MLFLYFSRLDRSKFYLKQFILKNYHRFPDENYFHHKSFQFFFQILASAWPISRVDNTQTRLSSLVRPDFNCLNECSAKSVENAAHIGERFWFQTSHDHRHSLAQFGTRLSGAHSVLHYRYNMIQSDVKVIIDFFPPTSGQYRADGYYVL